MILDTSFIIDVMKKEPNAIEKLNSLVKKGEPLMIASPTIFELFSGLVRSQRQLEEKNKVMNVINGQLVLPLDNKSAERSGEIDGTLVKEGKMIDPIDSMIAGIAIIKNDKVLTRNVKDFSRIKDLKIETY